MGFAEACRPPKLGCRGPTNTDPQSKAKQEKRRKQSKTVSKKGDASIPSDVGKKNSDPRNPPAFVLLYKLCAKRIDFQKAWSTKAWFGGSRLFPSTT